MFITIEAAICITIPFYIFLLAYVSKRLELAVDQSPQGIRYAYYFLISLMSITAAAETVAWEEDIVGIDRVIAPHGGWITMVVGTALFGILCCLIIDILIYGIFFYKKLYGNGVKSKLPFSVNIGIFLAELISVLICSINLLEFLKIHGKFSH